jgi:hypothetical protein
MDELRHLTFVTVVISVFLLVIAAPSFASQASRASSPADAHEATSRCGRVETSESYRDQFSLSIVTASQTSCRTAVSVDYATIARFCAHAGDCVAPFGRWSVLGWRCHNVRRNYTVVCTRARATIVSEYESPGGG